MAGNWKHMHYRNNLLCYFIVLSISFCPCTVFLVLQDATGILFPPLFFYFYTLSWAILVKSTRPRCLLWHVLHNNNALGGRLLDSRSRMIAHYAKHITASSVKRKTVNANQSIRAAILGYNNKHSVRMCSSSDHFNVKFYFIWNLYFQSNNVSVYKIIFN
jgi:hypothetical protein